MENSNIVTEERLKMENSNIVTEERFHKTSEQPKKEKYPQAYFSPMCLSGVNEVADTGSLLVKPYRNFTENKIYPIIEKKDQGCFQMVKTINDKGEEVWMNEDFFTLAEQRLLFGSTKIVDNEYFDSRDPIATVKTDTNLSCEIVNGVKWTGLVKNEDVPKLRSKDYKVPEKINVFVDLHTAGVAKHEKAPKTPENLSLKQQEELVLAGLLEGKNLPKKKMKATDDPWSSHNINEILSNTGRVFKEYSHFNHEVILKQIGEALPKRCITWSKENHLEVDGAKTNISHDKICNILKSFEGFADKALAEKIIGKIIVKKLKKLF